MAVIKESRGVKCSVRNIVSDVVMTMNGIRWLLDVPRGLFLSYINALETNIECQLSLKDKYIY